MAILSLDLMVFLSKYLAIVGRAEPIRLPEIPVSTRKERSGSEDGFPAEGMAILAASRPHGWKMMPKSCRLSDKIMRKNKNVWRVLDRA